MKRFIAAVGFCSISGCAHLLGPLPSRSPPIYAGLTVRPVPGQTLFELIFAIDKVPLNSPEFRVYIAQGWHTVTYDCPSDTSIAAHQELRFKFDAGQRYEIVCNRKDEQLVGEVRLVP